MLILQSTCCCDYSTNPLLLQVPEGLELAVSSMRAEEHALVTISDPALAAAPEGTQHMHSIDYACWHCNLFCSYNLDGVRYC
jgi:hypothetical protein